MLVRELRGHEIGDAIELAWEMFQKFASPDYSEQDVMKFYKSIPNPQYPGQLRVYGAFDGENIIGAIATCKSGNHIALFFVRGKYHRKESGELFSPMSATTPAAAT